MDYRDLAGERFDAIASIGMAEHVGAVQIDAYARTLAGLLGAGRAAAEPRDRPPAPHRRRGGRLLRALRLPRRRAAPPLAGAAGAGARRASRSTTSRTSAPTTPRRSATGRIASTRTWSGRPSSPARNGSASGASTCAPPATASRKASPRSTRPAASSASALVDPDQVAGRVADRAFADPVGLVGRLFDHVDVGGHQALEVAVEVGRGRLTRA